jgi:dihydrofolate reductase
MRKVIVGAMVSMDGVMQAPGGPEEDPTGGFKFGGWVAPVADVDPVFDEELGKLFGEPFDLLLGRRTYDIFAAYWPYAESGPYDDIAKVFNRITKYVATRKGTDLTWKGSVALRDAAKDVAKLKQGRPGPRHAGQHRARARLARRWLRRRDPHVHVPRASGQGQAPVRRQQPAFSFQAGAQRCLTERPHPCELCARWRGKDGHGRRRKEPSPAELARREKLKREG